MPYQEWKEINPALKGIRPKVSLEQANLIAKWADAMEKVEDGPKNPWAVAILQFKKSYTVRSGKWIERKQTKKVQEVNVEGADVMTIEIDGEQVTISELTEAWRFVNDLPDSSFAVIMPGGEKDDEGKTTPRSLRKPPYKDSSGKVDLPHLRNALARLPQMKGVSAELKTKALKKLQAEAKKNLETYQEETAVIENGDMEIYPPQPLAGATTFADLKAQEQAQSAAEEIHKLTWQFQMLINNVMSDETVEDKAGGIKAVADEFIALVSETLGAEMTGEEVQTENASETAIVESEATFSESEAGEAIQIVEDATPPQSDKRASLKLDVRLIKPGWGNKRDMHYYPTDVLRRDAKVFEGAKMYTSDHRAGEKSERTEVSVIEQIVGFADDGAPIARVAVFDPEFAEKTRNRAELGQLNTLECSILANGKARKGKIDGVEGNIIEAITSANSVDWVTKAGAGGQAISLAESEGGNPSPQPEGKNEVSAEQPHLTEETTAEPQTQSPPLQEQQPSELPDEPLVAQESLITLLSETEIDLILKTSRLPQLARDRLAGEQYHTVDELHKVVAAEIDYIKALTGSGKPFAQGGSSALRNEQISESDYQAQLDAIDQKYGLRKGG